MVITIVIEFQCHWFAYKLYCAGQI